MSKVIFCFILLFASLPQIALADTVYLKNGRAIEGFVKKESAKEVELEVGGGTVTFSREEIERVRKSGPEESAKIQEKWQKARERAAEEKAKYEAQPKEVSMTKESGQIAVEAVLNKRARCTLILDTGASMVVLTKNTARKAGIDLAKIPQNVRLRVADGREVNAGYAILESIQIEDAQARNVEAAVLLEDVNPGYRDGLLGMSFLKHFNFSVDHSRGKLVLEKSK